MNESTQQERCYKSSLAAGRETRPERVVVCEGGVYDERRFSRNGGGDAGRAVAGGTAGRATAGGNGMDEAAASEGTCGAEGRERRGSVTTGTGG